uniref:Uncharacterized protein n=1 Tax=Setaria italica TaxID=4555 RepID=K3YBN3_SETIT
MVHCLTKGAWFSEKLNASLQAAAMDGPRAHQTQGPLAACIPSIHHDSSFY